MHHSLGSPILERTRKCCQIFGLFKDWEVTVPILNGQRFSSPCWRQFPDGLRLQQTFHGRKLPSSLFWGSYSASIVFIQELFNQEKDVSAGILPYTYNMIGSADQIVANAFDSFPREAEVFSAALLMALFLQFDHELKALDLFGSVVDGYALLEPHI